MNVAGEVQVEILHWDRLSQAPAGGASLDTEHGANGGLTETGNRVPPDHPKPVGQTDERGRVALAGERRRHAGDAHELSVGGVAEPIEHRERHLRLEPPYGSSSSPKSPARSAICSIGMSSCSWAILRLLFMTTLRPSDWTSCNTN